MEVFLLLFPLLPIDPSEVKRQKSVPEDLKKPEEDRGSPTELDIRRPFEEEVCQPSYVCLHKKTDSKRAATDKIM